jgi:hypothetical protein
LLDDLWDKSFVRTVTAGFVVAIPARDILGFGDVGSSEAITELREVLARATGGDHLLTPALYRRQGQTWIQYDDDLH